MPSAEIEAMGAIEDAFVALDDETRARVLGWAYAKYAASSDGTMGRAPQQFAEPQSEPVLLAELEEQPTERPVASEFKHFGELYDHCNPSTNQDRFLVAAYWLHKQTGKESFGNAEINKLLREQGHENPSLNKVVDALRKKTPRLVIQIGGGASDKTRRVLKLNAPAMKLVEEMVENGG